MIINRMPKFYYNNSLVMGGKASITSGTQSLAFFRECRLSTSRALVFYKNNGNIYVQVVYTADGKTITLGTALYLLNSPYLAYASIVRLSDTKAVAIWTNSSPVSLCVLNISGNTITAGTTYSGLTSLAMEFLSDSIAVSSSQFILTTGTGSQKNIHLFNVTGNVVTLASESLIAATPTSYQSEIYALESGKYLVTFPNTSYRVFQVVGLSGTTFTTYTPTTVSNGGFGESRSVSVISSNRALYTYCDTYSPYTTQYGFVNIAVDGTITESTTGTFSPLNQRASIGAWDGTNFVLACYQPTTQSIVYMSNFKNPSADTRYYYTTFTNGFTSTSPSIVVMTSNLALIFCFGDTGGTVYYNVQGVIRS